MEVGGGRWEVGCRDHHEDAIRRLADVSYTVLGIYESMNL